MRLSKARSKESTWFVVIEDDAFVVFQTFQNTKDDGQQLISPDFIVVACFEKDIGCVGGERRWRFSVRICPFCSAVRSPSPWDANRDLLRPWRGVILAIPRHQTLPSGLCLH